MATDSQRVFGINEVLPWLTAGAIIISGAGAVVSIVGTTNLLRQEITAMSQMFRIQLDHLTLGIKDLKDTLGEQKDDVARLKELVAPGILPRTETELRAIESRMNTLEAELNRTSR